MHARPVSPRPSTGRRSAHRRASRVAAVIASVAVALGVVPSVGPGVAPVSAANPVIASGGRVVDVRNTNGTITRYTSIPSTSLFVTHGGGSTSRCSFVAQTAGTASDGTPFAAGQSVESTRWIFVEGLPESFGEPTPEPDAGSKGPLAAAVRWFTVFCDSTLHGIGIVAVPSRDPFFDPHQQLTTLRNRLQLTRASVFRNPVVDRWGGLVVRYQAWLAIGPAAWTSARSNVVSWRGWSMYLRAVPVALSFQVDFTPDPARPTTAFHGRVSCIARGTTAAGDARSLPAMPALPAQSGPGVNGPCRWTPPGPGAVTIRPVVSYQVTFWANAYTERLADYEWTGIAATFRVGELAVVNTDR